MHQLKSDRVIALRRGKGHKVPPLTKKLLATDTGKGKTQFSSMECHWEYGPPSIPGLCPGVVGKVKVTLWAFVVVVCVCMYVWLHFILFCFGFFLSFCSFAYLYFYVFVGFGLLFIFIERDREHKIEWERRWGPFKLGEGKNLIKIYEKISSIQKFLGVCRQRQVKGLTKTLPTGMKGQRNHMFPH